MDDQLLRQLSRRDMLRLTAMGLLGVPATATLTACGSAPATGQTAAVPATLRFGVGLLQPTPDECKTAFDPFFTYLATQLSTQYELTATPDWAGISVALANDQLDLAWMDPWG